MGAEASKSSAHKESKKPQFDKKHQKLDQRIVSAFETLSLGNETIMCKQFTDKFGEELGSDLWKYLSDGASEKCEMDIALFGQKILTLIGVSSDHYLELLQTPEQILRICARCAGVSITNDNDEKFLHMIISHMEKAGDSLSALIGWKNEYCSRLCDAVQMQVLKGFNLAPAPNLADYTSDVLSPLQMWFIHCSLPEIYFPQPKLEASSKDKDDSSSCCWTPLYSSSEQGISVTRFELNVFDYRGPTVAIFRLQNGQLFVLAVDQEWRNGGATFGSADCVFIQLLPELKRIQKSSSIYCNFKLRNFPMKLTFDPYVNIDKEMSEVIAVEAFGCSGSKTLEQQQKQKEWQRRQVEKNKKVPLPGKWDDNPDKYLLELGGVYTTDDRREVFRRED